MNMHWWSNFCFQSCLYGSDKLRPRRIHNYSLLADQPRPVVADVLFHTSQLSLAIPSYVGAKGTTNDKCCYCLVTKADNTRLFVQLVQRDQSQSQSHGQSACRRPCHKLIGRLPLHFTELVVTFPLTEHPPNITLPDDRGSSMNNLPKLIA